MSGGTWNYKNCVLDEIAESLGIEAEKDFYSDKVKSVFRKLSEDLKLMDSIIHSADYLIAGDIDEDTFLGRVQNDVENYDLLKEFHKRKKRK